MIPSTEIPRAAYVHVPFCVHRCGYCDFTVVAGRDDLIGPFLECLEEEIRRTLPEPQPVETLFIGGGTPSYLPAPELTRLLVFLSEWLPVQPGGEFSVECNPERFTSERMDVFVQGGVNRISLGVQSFDPRHLSTLERSHAPETVADVVERLRSRGVDNVSFDLIFAVPGQTVSDWEETLHAATALRPEHLSTYGLTYEKGTQFWSRRSRAELIPETEESERRMYDLAMTLLPEQGYEQYELSNFARPGFRCRHNQVYWNGEAYYGFGPGAAAFLEGVRSTNHRSVSAWLRRIRAGEPGVMEEERLTPELDSREAVMLGLRKFAGIERQAFRQRYGTTVRDLAPEKYDRFVSAGLLEETDSHVRLTREGRFLADTVVAEFL